MPSFKRFLKAPPPKTEKRDVSAGLSLDEWAASYFQFGGNTYPFSGFGGGSDLYTYGSYSGSGTPGTQENIGSDFLGYTNGALKASGVVFACMQARMSVFSDARFVFQEFNGTRPGDLMPSQELQLLEIPWPRGTSAELLCRAIMDADLAGNAFFVRKAGPKGMRLWRLRPDWTFILMSGDPMKDPYVEVLAHVYKPGNTEDASKWEVFPIDGSNGTVAHWSPLPDPEAQYRGMSWLTPVIREIMTDKAVSLQKLKFFENGVTPQLAVTLDAATTPEQFAEFKALMDQTKVGVQHSYETLYLGGGADVKVVGTNGADISFKDVSSIGEMRIAAAARVPPTLLGLTEGMRGSALNEGNFQAAKNAFADGTLRPLWRSFCTALSPLINVPKGQRLWYDDRDISFLREDQQSVAMRQQTEATTMARLVQDGWEAESVVSAIRENDWSLLTHSGLYSVQLLPPGIAHAAGFDGDLGPQGGGGDGSDSEGSGSAVPNNYPTGSKKKPVGRPPNSSGGANNL